MLIFSHDPDLSTFAYNELAHRVQVRGAAPWDRPADNPYWRDADTAQLKALIDVRYLPFSTRNHDVCFTKIADDRRFHPIRDYLDALPPWDGAPRVESLFVRCLLAEDAPYVRAVSRKTFAGAVARIYRPGTKFDSVPVFDGAQGIGKSTLFKDLVGDEYYSETLSLTDMDDKSGAEKLQGFWVVEIGELAGMKKADIEKVKAFLSTSDDKYRPSYGKTVESHPRQCIIIAKHHSRMCACVRVCARIHVNLWKLA
jgi:predicted P-loop ATPase